MKSNAIIFGVGANYKRLYRAVCSEYNIIACSDNDESKWGKVDSLSGKTIIPPSRIKEIIGGGESKIFITPFFHSDIALQLLTQLCIPQVFAITADSENGLKLVKHYMDNEVLISEYGSIRVAGKASVDIIVEVIAGHTYEIEYPFSYKDTIIIDIGMHVGCTSLYFAQKENVEKIYSFEPYLENYKDASVNFALNSTLSHKIVPHNFGLGNKNHSNLTSRNLSCRNVTDEQTKITIKDSAETLGPIINGLEKKNIWLKCDCEGGEYDIFESLDKAGLLPKIDVITMEWHGYRLSFLKEILIRNGFAFSIADYLGIGMIYAFHLTTQ